MPMSRIAILEGYDTPFQGYGRKKKRRAKKGSQTKMGKCARKCKGKKSKFKGCVRKCMKSKKK